jgi:thiol-disulfide isomerase/thioredoxin
MLLFALALLADPIAGAALANTEISRPEAALYDPARNASADVDAAIALAKTNGKNVILVMGANWCHDSKSLAGRFETPRFKAMMGARYEIVYVDVGTPQTGHGRNIDIAKRFGIKKIKGTPTVLILSSGGKLLNKKDAPNWRNAASRSDDSVYAAFDTPGLNHG